MIDIFSVPVKTTVNKSMKGKKFNVVGFSKTGKSTLASQAPRPIFLATENGTEAITGITPIPIATWPDFKQAVNQLCTEKGRESFDTVVIDTATNLMLLLDKYIGAKMSTDKNPLDFASEAEYGKGTRAMKNELGIQLQKLANQGYLIFLITHAESKTDFNTGKDYVGTSLSNSLYGVIEKSVDETIYLTKSIGRDGTEEHRIWFSTKGGFSGTGGRFPVKQDYVPCSYENLENAMQSAISGMDVDIVDTSTPSFVIDVEGLDFDALMAEFKDITGKLVEANAEENVAKIVRITEKTLGVGKKVSNMTANQADLLSEIIADLKSEFGL